MSWRDLIPGIEMVTVIAPWLGGRQLRQGQRTWDIQGPLPAEHGWFKFRVLGRKVEVLEPTLAVVLGQEGVSGFLVGDRIVGDYTNVDPDPKKIVAQSEQVHLIDPGLDRFARVVAHRPFDDGPLVYIGPLYPLGPEPDVQRALEDGLQSLDAIPGVTPALDAAFRMELYQRQEAARRRAELERLRLAEEAKHALEARRNELVQQLGDGAGRREMAKVDFGEAAKAALQVGGAQYLDHRESRQKNEMVVRFRMINRRFECTCDRYTLRIIDAGICLIDHRNDKHYDDYFTLESLPGVIRQAEAEHKLVVFRVVK